MEKSRKEPVVEQVASEVTRMRTGASQLRSQMWRRAEERRRKAEERRKESVRQMQSKLQQFRKEFEGAQEKIRENVKKRGAHIWGTT